MRLGLERGEPGYRVGDKLLERGLGVDHLVDERAVGPVLEQPPHQIGQEVLMAADRGVDPTGDADMLGVARSR